MQVREEVSDNKTKLLVKEKKKTIINYFPMISGELKASNIKLFISVNKTGFGISNFLDFCSKLTRSISIKL